MTGGTQANFDMSELCEAVQRMEERARQVPMAVVAAPFVTAIDDEIQSEGRGRWPGFAEATLRMHPHRKGGKLLQDTGRLANIQVYDMTAVGSAVIFSPAEYAWKHADGYKRIPKRDFLDIDMDDTLEKACNAVVQEIVSGG